MNQSPFKCFATHMTHPLFKLMCSVFSYERGLKRILLLYERIIQPCLSLLWLQLMTHFVIFHPYDTPTFKTEALPLAGNEGRVKRLLLVYKWLI